MAAIGRDGNGGSAILSADQIRNYASQAGFTGTVLDNMVGIAFAESGGNPLSHNSTPPDDSYGLWQINMIGSLGPERRRKFGIDSNDRLYNASVNAHAAYIIYKESGLNAWTTYKSGAYLKYTGGKGGSGGQSAPVGTGEQFSSLAAVYTGLNNLGADVLKAAANSIGLGVAVILLAIGVFVLLSQSKAGKQAVKTTVGKVVP